MNPAMKNGRCRMHGGLTPRGTDLPQFSHGRFSRSLPDRLVERYETALADTERHDLRDEIALAETKIADLLAQIGESEGAAGSEAESEAVWRDLERWMSRKQRTVEADVRVARIREEMVPAEEVMAIMAVILDSIRRHVADQATRSAIAREIRALGTRRGGVVPLRRDEGSEE